jgi:hypothetical protein
MVLCSGLCRHSLSWALYGHSQRPFLVDSVEGKAENHRLQIILYFREDF